VAAEDVLLEGLRIELLGILLVAGEAVDAVGDGQTAVNSALEDTEETRAGSGASNTNVEVGAEGLRSLAVGLNVELLASDVDLTLVGIAQVQLGENAASAGGQ